MMPCKHFFYLLFLALANLFTPEAYAGGEACAFNASISSMVEKSHASIDGVDIKIFSGEKPYPNSEEEERPMLAIACSQNAKQLLVAVGVDKNGKKYKIRLVAPPFSFMIEERHPLPRKGLELLTKKGWKIYAEVIGYRKNNGGTGPDILCVTAVQLDRSNSIAASKCSSFSAQETANFKSILDSLSIYRAAESEARPP
ncbi:hypothetical protein J2W34_003029 [Variovorax boronicumulans]|uniref:hypothetical protein n=1 Tax=Variovorax boronicumulans TaxID=436515 RepID=UPI00278A5331|nr:hypothetical protein [Variovorax boronicumulans]MDQ0071235.1 hypothetical protein [Variovorax boronicumulans]